MTDQPRSSVENDFVAELQGSADDLKLLLHGDHHEPHRLLGAHPATVGGRSGVIVRAFHPDATRAECLLASGGAVQLAALGNGIFAAFLPDASLPVGYCLRFHFSDGNSW